MNNGFMLFLSNSGDFRFGFYRAVALFPATHKKGNKLWLPYPFIMDMSRALILAERRNFQENYTQSVQERFNLVINVNELSHLPLVDIWRPYHGQQIMNTYASDQCFPLEIEERQAHLPMKNKHLPSLSNTPLYEWYFDKHVLIRFFSDPRFQGFLHHSGFQTAIDQMQFDLQA